MKVIELLNKIANGEKIPKKIRYHDMFLTYDENNQDYYDNNYETVCGRRIEGCRIDWRYAIFCGCLNDEVEIIENTLKEDQEIERLNKELDTSIEICNNKQKEIVRLNNIINELEKYLRNEYSKFNGAIRIANILDKLKELKEGK